MNIRNYIDRVSALQLFQLMRFGTLIIVGIILVKFGYNTHEIGRYELFFFLANVLSFFWTMGLKNALLSFYPSIGENKQKVLFFNLGLILLFLAFIAGFVLYLLQGSLGKLFKVEGDIQQINWIITYLIFNALGNFTEYIYLLKEKYQQIVWYGGIIFCIQLSLIVFGVCNGFSIQELILLMVFWSALKFCWFIFMVFKHSKAQLNLDLAKSFLVFSLPLIIHILLGNGMEYVDGFIVNHFFDEGVFAQFRYGARELPFVSILAGAVSTAIIPVAVNSTEKALLDTKTKVNQLIKWLFPLSSILILTSPWLFRFVYSVDYLISAQIFNIYLLIICSRLLMPQIILFSRHRNQILMWSAAIELLINILLSLWWIRFWGVLGIAWATVVAYLFNKLFLAYWVKREYEIRLADYLNLKNYFFWTGVLVICYLISIFVM